MAEQNWAGNVDYLARRVRAPVTIDELQHIVAESSARGRRIHALGSRHSFNRVADTDGDLISTADLNRIVDIDHSASTVRVQGGIRYAELSSALQAEGLALANLPSLPHITVAGAVSTGTHGSGIDNPSLSASVVAIELVTANGELVRMSAADDDNTLSGAVVGLGALGVVATLTLTVEPAFEVEQTLWRSLPIDEAADHLDEIMSVAYSVSLFTNWTSGEFHQVWVKRRTDTDLPGVPSADDALAKRFGLRRAETALHMVPGVSPDACTEQLGRRGPWHERLPHFRPEFTPSVGAELQSEYFVDRSDGPDALRAVYGLADRLAPLLLATEVRTVAADGLWLSPASGRNTLALHFTWRLDQPRVMALLPHLELALAPFAARPHWGKLTAMPANEIRTTYTRFDDFVGLADRLDPTRLFRNDYLDDLLQ